MNKKGFTLVELLATLVILGVIIGITVVVTSTVFKNTKEKSEDVFISTIEDALDMYLDSDAKNLHFSKDPDDAVCQLSKTHGVVDLFRAMDDITFEDVINSSVAPITKEEMVNPANKGSQDAAHPYECNVNGLLEIYRDADYVYYYRISKKSFECFTKVTDDDGKDIFLSNLPSEMPSDCKRIIIDQRLSSK